jgi:putative transposase
VRPDGTAPRAYGRFEASEFGELWTGDGLHGPLVAGATAILFAFVDDFSRAVVGWRWGHAEDTVRLEAAFRRGLESAGVPRAVFVDRGSAFMSAPFHRTLATLGIRIIHSRPGYPASRGKVERFFATVRSQFLVELQAHGGAEDLSQLNELFGAWLEGAYHRTVHSETKQTQLERRVAAAQLRRPSPAELHDAFLWAERRQVSKTAQVSLFGNAYEVDPALVGVRVELLFDPFDLSQIEVRYQNRLMGQAVRQRIGRHTHPTVKPAAAPPPKASGIDYLALVKDRLEREQRDHLGRITYRKFAAPDTDADTTGEEDPQ